MSKRICEKCEGIYATGKSYGNWWQQFDLFGIYKHLETKGLCEYCNPKTLEYAAKNNSICTTLICEGCDRWCSFTNNTCNKYTRQQKEKIYQDKNYIVYSYDKVMND